jgi:hypothetical protein
MPFRRNRPRHRLGHLQLLRPTLIIRQPRRNAASRAKDIGSGERVHSINLADESIR